MPSRYPKREKTRNPKSLITVICRAKNGDRMLVIRLVEDAL